MRNRYYDPASGRFTQEDPIGIAGGLNVYGYANGDPVSYSDPFGLCPYGKSAKERNTDTSDCPTDAVGKGVRTLAKYGGVRGHQAIKHMAREGLNPALTSGEKLQAICGQDAGACITHKGKIVLTATNQATIASQLMHEVGHDIIPDLASWDQTYMHEEPIVSEWMMEVWGGIPSNLQPRRGGYRDMYQEYKRDRTRWRQGRVDAACRFVQSEGGTC